ncbi:hypothetical protein O6H91_11G039300 [Diphasiastrum complanatum]|nr:hypothetical protein O6H91_Y154000 [Diphasiastrum complanatum]KAJ7538243.1 hypothetical protein O6H91_11G039300 [Diphasiastrum complanatum]
MNEKDAENAATVFGSFEFSLEAMTPYARDLFTSLAALSWEGPIPEACLETMWSSLNQNSTFRLVLNRLLEGSLLERANSDLLYRVHDMVALFLETRATRAVQLLLTDPDLVAQAAVAPWLFAFGNITTQQVAESTLVRVLRSDEKLLPVRALWTVVDVLSASNTVTELQTISYNFTNLVGPEFVRLLSLDTVDLTSAVARCTANCFTVKDYMYNTNSLVEAGAIEKLAFLVKHHQDALVKHDAANVLARLVEFMNFDNFEDVLKTVPVKEVVELLDPNLEETHERVINALMRLAKVGEEVAVKQIFTAGIDRKLAAMLESGSELAQRRAIVAIKSFHEVGGSKAVGNFLRSGILNRIPWQARLSLERFNKLDRGSSFEVLPKRQTLERLAAILEAGSEEEKIDAIQDMIPIVEKADNPDMKDMILKAGIVESLSKLLQLSTEDFRVKSEASFALTKLSCSGGEACIRRMIKAKVVESLVEMMNAPSKEILDTAYSTLHDMIETGRHLITDRILQANLTEKLLVLLDGPIQNSIQIGLQCVQDLVLMGGKQCIERLLTLQIVEKLALLGNVHSCFKDAVIDFAKYVEKCEGLSVAERRVLNQQVLRKMRSEVKDSNQLANVATILHGLAKDNDGLIRRRSSSSNCKF